MEEVIVFEIAPPLPAIVFEVYEVPTTSTPGSPAERLTANFSLAAVTTTIDLTPVQNDDILLLISAPGDLSISNLVGGKENKEYELRPQGAQKISFSSGGNIKTEGGAVAEIYGATGDFIRITRVGSTYKQTGIGTYGAVAIPDFITVEEAGELLDALEVELKADATAKVNQAKADIAQTTDGIIALLNQKEAVGVASFLVNSLQTSLLDGIAADKNTFSKLYNNLNNKITDIQLILQSPDVDLDTFVEVVAFIKANQDALDNIGVNKLNISVYNAFLLQYASDLALKLNKSVFDAFLLQYAQDIATFEPTFTKNTAFNKNFGTTAGTIAEGNHSHHYNSLTGLPALFSGNYNDLTNKPDRFAKYTFAELVNNPHLSQNGFTHFDGPGGFIGSTSGSGAISGNEDGQAGSYGLYELNTGTTTTGRAHILRRISLNTKPVSASVANYYFASLVEPLPQLSDATETYVFYAGMFSSESSAQPEGCMILHNRAISPTNWVIRCKGAVDFTLDTGIPISTTSKVLFEIEVNAAMSQAKFYINSVLVHTETTANRFDPGRLYMWGASMIKSAGTTPRNVVLDAMMVDATLVGNLI